MILINVHQLEKSFASKTLFKNLSLSIEEKQRIGLVGPNGAGKSTLLKILVGRLDADAGQVSRKKGLRMGFLDQVPTFDKQQSIIQAVQEKLQDKDEFIGLTYELLSTLDLLQFGEDFLVQDLSGGWKKRVALARELVLEPELLFLDEPTNHLDVSSILWLEEYLSRAPFAVMMITHDRLFLQRVVNRVLDLDPRNPHYLLSVQGDYAQYLESKEQELAALARQETVLRNTLRRETEWLRRGAQARQTKQKARIQSATQLADTVGDLTRKNASRRVSLDFGETENGPKKLIQATDISKSYQGRCLFSDVSLLITPKTRLAILGDNGCGKSTLLKILLGHEAPDQGKVVQAEGIKISYFEQSRETLDPQQSVLKNICPEGDYVSYQGRFIHARGYLERFHFRGVQMDLPVGKLSGGEQARLRLAQLMLIEAQVLVLDEPTNDLDSETLEVLEEALREFQGAVILVTHDRYFMDSVADHILAFPVGPSEPPCLEMFTGYLQWEAWYDEQKSSQNQTFQSSTPSSSATAKPNESSEKKLKLSYKESKELATMEADILALEAQLEQLNTLSLSSEVMSNATRLIEIHQQMADLQNLIDQKYARWAELEKKQAPHTS